MAEVKSRISKAWQICVVDRSILNFSNINSSSTPCFNDLVRRSSARDGEVMFVISTHLLKFDEFGKIPGMIELMCIPRYGFMNGVMFSYVWRPEKKVYDWIFHGILQPILSKQDAIEAETTLGAKLESSYDN